MNISSLNAAYKNYNLGINNKTNIINKINSPIQDTISFTGDSNARKIIQQLKNSDKKAITSLKTKDEIDVLTYFGYRLKGYNGDHAEYANPVNGRKLAVIDTNKMADPNAIKMLREAVCRADEFNGELILFPKAVSEEEIEKIKQETAKYELNPNNKYRKELEKKQAETKKIDKNNTMEILNKISMINYSLNEYEEEIRIYEDLIRNIISEYPKPLSKQTSYKIKELIDTIENDKKYIEETRQQIAEYEAKDNLAEEEIEEINLISEKIYDTENIYNLVSELEENLKIKPETKLDTKADIKIEKNVQELYERITNKIITLNVPSISTALTRMLETGIKPCMMDMMSKDAKLFKENIGKEMQKVKQLPEFNRFKQALRYSLIENISSSDSKDIDNIYSLTLKQLQELQVEPLENVETTFEKYNTKLDKVTKEKVKEELLKYAPINKISDEDSFNIDRILSEQGKYLENILSENCDSSFKKDMLVSFYANIDSKLNTNYSKDVICNFEKELKQKEVEKMQKRKLDAISKIDWSI